MKNPPPARFIFLGSAVGAIFLLASMARSAPHNFAPDVLFKGSSLSGWHVLGAADWKAQDGELIGSAKPGSAGGWLVLDKSYQDIAFVASVRCSGDCKAGILLRAQKTEQGGMKGLYVSLSKGDFASYRVTLDGQGRELTRQTLKAAGGQTRYASVGPTVAGGRGEPAAVAAPAPAAQGRGGPAIDASNWNTVQVILDADLLRVSLNDRGGIAGGDAEDVAAGFGPVALYAGGSGEVRFREVAYKDLHGRVAPAEQVSSRFRMQRLNEFLYSWSVAVADINRDNIPDVVAGPYYYLGPDYTVAKEIYLAQTYNPSTQPPSLSRIKLAYDFTGDGWPDVLSPGPGDGMLYVNPKGESRRWDKYKVLPQTTTEIALLRDIDGDGKPEVIYGGGGAYAYANPDPQNPTAPWIVHRISENVTPALHALGVGDINGDGRLDILHNNGWWEQPPKGTSPGPWPYHPWSFGGREGGAEMAVYDVNGDGLNDVVTSLAAHGWGLAWFEQKRDKDSKISFVEHMIMDDFSTKNAGDATFSQMHGSAFADMDGDGIPDFVTGKRYWSHLDSYADPDPYGAPVLYVYKTVRNPRVPGGAEFVPELVHNRSGVGCNVVAVDLNGDGAPDIVTSGSKGTFIFWGKLAGR